MCLSTFGGALSVYEGCTMQLQEHGIYIVKDAYFNEFASAGWMWNKKESRPHYLALKDSSGLVWMIPMSSRVENYKAKISRIEKQRGAGNCLYYHIGVIAGKERAFVVSGMFPVTPDYISHPYTINRIPYVVADKRLVQKLNSKMRRYLRLLEQGVMQDANHVLAIRNKLLQRQK